MDHRSLWQKTSSLPATFPPLLSDLTCEVVVIGAGLTGILTACLLQEQGMNVVVLESGTPGQGVTAHTTAKITAQHGYFYSNLISSHGIDTARQYFRANQSSIDFLSDFIKNRSISCDFQKTDCYLFARSSSSTIRTELRALKAIGESAEFTTDTQLPFPVSGALKLQNQAVFHPLQFLYALLPHLQIYGKSTVKKITGRKVLTDHAVVNAKHIIVATRFPFFLLPGFYFARMHQDRSYALSLSGPPPLADLYIDAEKNGIYFRSWKDQIILSGFGHRTGHIPIQNGYDALSLYAQRLYPGHQVTAQWSAEDCIPADGIPFIGSYKNDSAHIYIATGFQKWGMTTCVIAARILSDLVCGRKNEYTDFFSPHHAPGIKGCSQILHDSGISTGNLLKQVFYVPRSKLKDVNPGQGAIVQWNGCKTGVFHHEDGTYYFVSTRCPHMGCQLNWNSTERSWDCPCHGSRFSYDGTRIDPPAVKNLTCHCRRA